MVEKMPAATNNRPRRLVSAIAVNNLNSRSVCTDVATGFETQSALGVAVFTNLVSGKGDGPDCAAWTKL